MRRGARGGRGRSGFAGQRPQNTAMMRQKILGNTANSAKRLMKDYEELKAATIPLVGVSAAPRDDNFYVWCANIRGPENTAYEGGVFHLEITFPQNYPLSPPTIKLSTAIPHPNVFGTTLCLDMLQESGEAWYQGWCSAYTVESVLMQLQSFLFEVPKLKQEHNLMSLAKPADEMSELFSNNEHRTKYKIAVDAANEYKCSFCKHRGPLEPYPPFSKKERDENEFKLLKTPKEVLGEEFMCYHTRNRLPMTSLGIGVSLSRLPRTGEIRSVTPTLDLICIQAFIKQKVRKSISNERFTHWLPLYFGEEKPFEVKKQVFDEQKKEYVNQVYTVNPKERFLKLLDHSLSFLTKGNTKKGLTEDMVLEVMPKLITTHLVDMVNEKNHISITAIRRLINFIRLFRVLIELKPEVSKTIDARLKTFIDHPDKRVKDHTPALGDLLAFSAVSDTVSLGDLLNFYLDEQLDRQAFWIIQKIPELDHTDEKFKGKEIVLEESRSEVCFKTGLVGFQITMIFYTLCQVIEKKFGRNWKNIEASLDANFGCLSLDDENDLQKQFKEVQRIETFKDYYSYIGVQCPDAEALAVKLRQAVTNSKQKKYHGSSEHMNVLPPMADQAEDFLLAEPSPFSQKDPNDPFWKEACMKRFDWINRLINCGDKQMTPAQLAMESDKKATHGEISRDRLQDLLIQTQQPGNVLPEIQEATVYDDYPASFTWMKLFHKLCFEQLLENFSKLAIPRPIDDKEEESKELKQANMSGPFKLFYDYLNKIGDSIEVLRIPSILKTRLKSNHFWIMPLVTKLKNLRAIKMHLLKGHYIGPDFFNFFKKANDKLAANSKQFDKIQINGLLGNASADYLYPCLKSHTNLVVLDVSDNTLTQQDAKAIGKCLTDFKGVRELNISRTGLNTDKTKELADGLMRAKQLEILKASGNPNMGRAVNAILYNLAFSPKIRHIDLSDMAAGSKEMAEALYKLIKISGAIEVLILKNTGVAQFLNEDFYKSLGENKTLSYLNLDTTQPQDPRLLGKAIAMNARRNGALTSLSMVQWINGTANFNNFIASMYISDYDHEVWYGDTKQASEMKEEQLVKHLHTKLTFLNIRHGPFGGLRHNFKEIEKQVEPKPWPQILAFAAQTPLDLNLKRCNLIKQDMETFAYMLGENPKGVCKLRSLSLSLNYIRKEGAKILAPAIAINKSLEYLNLSSCYLGVSGVTQIAAALEKNTSIKALNLFHNICDVDGARAIAKTLQKNSTIEFLDIGHNRVRITGLKAITQGILANPTSKLCKLGLRSNFINDEGISDLFDQLILPKDGRKQQLTSVFLAQNFFSEYHKVDLYKKFKELGLSGKIYVDEFEVCELLPKERVDKGIWIAPMPKTMIKQESVIKNFFQGQYDCGLIADVRVRVGKKVPGRTKENCYCFVEYVHENSVPRSLKLASKKLAKFSGVPVRIYKAGTKTAVVMPSQKRK